MSFFTTFMKNVKEFYSEINAATLTGAIDVIVVEQEDGSFKSSPFHVRFGKMGVLKAREKVVDLEINGEPVDIWMKLDDTGAAFFVEDVDEDDENCLLLSEITSPLPNRIGHYFEKATEEEAENEQVTLEEVEEEVEEDLELKRNVRKKRKKRRELRLTRSGSRMTGDDMFDMDDLNDADTEDEANETDVTIKSISELIDETEGIATSHQEEPTRISFSSGYYSEPELPELRAASAQMSQSDHDIFSIDQTSAPIQVGHACSEPSLDNLEEQCNEDVGIWRWGELPKQEDSANVEEVSKSWFSWSNKSQPKEETVGVYLDDIADDPGLMATYIGNFKPEQADPLALVERIDSGYDETMDLKATSTDPGVDVNPDISISLCGEGSTAEKEDPVTPDQFLSRELTHQDFVEKIRENPNFLSEKELLVRLNEKYVSWETAGPILMSCVLYKKPLPDDLISELTKDCASANLALLPENDQEAATGNKSSSWFSWFGGKSQSGNKEKECEQEDSIETVNVDNPEVDVVDIKPEQISPSLPEDIIGGKKMYRKTMRLSSEQLAKLNLKRGSNEVEFSVTTAFQGTSRCRCHIYLWHHSDKVVISDIDGTITKSDVLGHLLPVIGKDWAQSGVAQLYTKIRNNGYQIMYLSARAIGQSTITKDYLQSLKQGDVCLPEGPLFLNPDSLIHAFKREVIDRNPEEFKIRCLKDIHSLFEGKNPFFAGYGNRSNDAYAYRAVGIPVSRIFTINPAGELKHELTQNFQTSYESQSLEVDYYFPNIHAVKQIKEKFQAFPRKQSVYFDASDYMSIEEVAAAASENLSDTEEQVKPFRLRSGTDISDSLSMARLKFKHLKSQKTEALTESSQDRQVQSATGTDI